MKAKVSCLFDHVLAPFGPTSTSNHIEPVIIWRRLPLLLLAILIFVLSVRVGVATAESRPPAPETLLTDLEMAVAGHRTELAELNQRMAQLKQFQAALDEELHAYSPEGATHQQLLLMSQHGMEGIERAIWNNRTVQRKMLARVDILQSHYNAAAILFMQTDEQIKLARKQLADIRDSRMPDETKRALEQMAVNLSQVLKDKAQLGTAYQALYTSLSSRLDKTIEDLEAFEKSLSAQVETRLRRMLLTPTNTYRHIFSSAMVDSLIALKTRIGKLFTRQLWQAQWNLIQRDDINRWVLFAFWLVLIIVVQARLKRYLDRFEAGREGPEWYYRGLIVFLLRRSLLFLGLTLLFSIYGTGYLPIFNSGLSRLLQPIFLMLLLTCWGLNYFKYRHNGDGSSIKAYVAQQLSLFLRLLRFLVAVSILIIWIAGRDSLLVWVSRDLAAVVVLAWTARFWHRWKPFITEQVRIGVAIHNPRRLALVQWWSYTVTGIAVLVSVSGYSILAAHWSSAWIKTATILFWSWISLNAIGEWQQANEARQSAATDDPSLTRSIQTGWALIHLVRAVWLVTSVMGIIWAWDRAGVLMLRVETLFRYSFNIGTLQFSIRGIVLAATVIFFTYLAVNIGRALLDEKLLNNKTLEPGLRDSIRSIITYLAWGLGILVALATIGVDATSLAVVFGALSVGIGFGLQNIFNNFISGLILLFERPIQVGDVVEVNGIWAEVKKINVRATVVQTYDNASLIIPNSEFVSQQVTNWSFKDKRTRFNLEVGVAYGSDIELVEKTLLEIVQDFQNVLKYPKPEVLFMNHGDSALIFRLRIWVHVDDYFKVPSRIRFEIDRRFRERNIEIAFPQRDIHIRTVAGGAVSSKMGLADES